MKAVADTLAVARSNLIERVSRRAKSRRPYRKAGDDELLRQDALIWAHEEDLLHLIKFGPAQPKAAIHWHRSKKERRRHNHSHT